MNAQETMRLDKWLWAARFFKTRQLAAEAVNGGKVHLNGQRTKPGRDVRIGTRMRIHIGSFEWDIEVLQLPAQRRPAKEAVTFYAETEASQAERQRLMDEQKAARAAGAQPSARPDKRDRRMIHRFKQGQN